MFIEQSIKIGSMSRSLHPPPKTNTHTHTSWVKFESDLANKRKVICSEWTHWQITSGRIQSPKITCKWIVNSLSKKESIS